jgi:uncharacterized protein DUF3187
MRLRRWTFAITTALLLATAAARAGEEFPARAGERAALATEPEHAGPGETGLLGPLRIRDMTPFNLLRLDMLPAHAVEAGPGSWAIEAGLSFSNTFAMSDNVREYLRHRAGALGAGAGLRAPLSAADVAAIQAMGQDAYYVDGEFDLLEATFHYRVRRRMSVYVTLSAYDFTGGFMDGTIEGFHDSMNIENAGRQYVSRGRFQSVMEIGGAQSSSLAAPLEFGLGDPVIGMRQAFPLDGRRWTLVLSGEVKVAWRGEREALSTGTNDYGLQAALQGKFDRRAVYFNASFVSTDGQVFGIPLDRRIVPTVTAAYETSLTSHANFIVQVYASRSTVQDTTIDLLKADKYQASLGVRSRRGRIIYGLAVTENIKNFDNTPDVGMNLSLAWADLKP